MEGPSAYSKFAFFLLLGGLALILMMLGALKYLPVPPKGKPAGAVQPQAKPGR